MTQHAIRTAVAITAAAVVVLAGAGIAAAGTSDPAHSVDAELLDRSLDCPDRFAHPDREPVLLVHGTGTHGHEQFDWNWLVALPPRGFDVCVVTYPDRGLGDQQVSAEYVAHAIITMHEATGRQVDLMGHSQGASMPRWAVRFWPSARAALDDYVGIAGPYHGTAVVGDGGAGLPGGQMPEAFFQFRADSRFTTILNTGDETPGEVDWTNLATQFDELVQPVETAALDRGLDNPRVANIVLQDLCPGRVVDHLTIGTTDRLAFELAVDAFTHDGPADPARLGPGPTCSIPDQLAESPDQGTSMVDLLLQGAEGGFPDLHLASEEPATKDYARAGEASSGTAEDSGADVSRSDAPAPDDTATPQAAPVATVANAGRPGLPATGGGLAALGLGALVTARTVRRRRRR